MMNHTLVLYFAQQRYIYYKGDDGGGQGNDEVGAKLVAHAAALRLGGHYGGVADKGEVVAKEGSAHCGGCHHGHVESRLGSQATDYWYEGGNGAH